MNQEQSSQNHYITGKWFTQNFSRGTKYLVGHEERSLMNVIFVKEVFHGINAFEVALLHSFKKGEKNIRRKHNSLIDMYII